MLHTDLYKILYENQFIVKKVFKEFAGLHELNHFSLDLVTPDEKMLFLSSTPSHGYEICKRGYAAYDGIISPEFYKKNEFYWWEDASHKAYANEINLIREDILGLKNGFMLVRKINDFYIIYSFATNSNSMDTKIQIANNVNDYLKFGDFAYGELRNTCIEYCGEVELPLIKEFIPYQGVTPVARNTPDYNRKPNIISSNFLKG